MPDDPHAHVEANANGASASSALVLASGEDKSGVRFAAVFGGENNLTDTLSSTHSLDSLAIPPRPTDDVDESLLLRYTRARRVKTRRVKVFLLVCLFIGSAVTFNLAFLNFSIRARKARRRDAAAGKVDDWGWEILAAAAGILIGIVQGSFTFRFFILQEFKRIDSLDVFPSYSHAISRFRLIYLLCMILTSALVNAHFRKLYPVDLAFGAIITSASVALFISSMTVLMNLMQYRWWRYLNKMYHERKIVFVHASQVFVSVAFSGWHVLGKLAPKRGRSASGFCSIPRGARSSVSHPPRMPVRWKEDPVACC